MPLTFTITAHNKNALHPLLNVLSLILQELFHRRRAHYIFVNNNARTSIMVAANSNYSGDIDLYLFMVRTENNKLLHVIEKTFGVQQIPVILVGEGFSVHSKDNNEVE